MHYRRAELRESSTAPMTLLYELHKEHRQLITEHEIYIDGGVMRGTDILKALCLGARGVGLGRPFLYGNAVWGEAGCRRVIESECSALRFTGTAEVTGLFAVMREEIVTSMRLMGVTRLDQLNPSLIRYVDREVTARL